MYKETLLPEVQPEASSASIISSFNPETKEPEPDVLFHTAYGIIQFSRFDKLLDIDRGGLGEGETLNWSLELDSGVKQVGTEPSGRIAVEQEYGSKIKMDLETITKKFNGHWYMPVIDSENGDIVVDLEEEQLPPVNLRADTDAVISSTVNKNEITLKTIYGPLNLSYYDGLTAHFNEEMKFFTYDAYISDEYKVMLDIQTTDEGFSTTISPAKLLYFLETKQCTLYNSPSNNTNQVEHFLANGFRVYSGEHYA